jgi:hypothetical protein
MFGIFLVSLGTQTLRALCRHRAELVMENLASLAVVSENK